MWKIVSVLASTKEEVEKYLALNYEPFAVTEDMGSERIWMKLFEEKKVAVRSKQKQSAKRGSGKSASKSKA